MCMYMSRCDITMQCVCTCQDVILLFNVYVHVKMWYYYAMCMYMSCVQIFTNICQK